MAPIAGALMPGFGWAGAMQILGLVVLPARPAAFVLKGNALRVAAAGAMPVGTRAAIGEALRNRNFLLLGASFFVCGFHVAFLATHLPGVIALCGLPVQYGAWSLALIGLFNIVGSVAMGWAVGRWCMKSLLALVYASRALAALIFLRAQNTGTRVLVLSAVRGLTFLSTVLPTSRAGGQVLRPGQHGHAVRHRRAVAPGRRLPRRLARRARTGGAVRLNGDAAAAPWRCRQSRCPDSRRRTARIARVIVALAGPGCPRYGLAGLAPAGVSCAHSSSGPSARRKASASTASSAS